MDHFTYKGHLCIITEFCDAGDLYQLLRSRKTPLREPELLDMFSQVVRLCASSVQGGGTEGAAVGRVS